MPKYQRVIFKTLLTVSALKKTNPKDEELQHLEVLLKRLLDNAMAAALKHNIDRREAGLINANKKSTDNLRIDEIDSEEEEVGEEGGRSS